MKFTIPISPKRPSVSKLSSVFNRFKLNSCSEGMENLIENNECFKEEIIEEKSWLSCKNNFEKNDDIFYSTIPQWIDGLMNENSLKNLTLKNYEYNENSLNENKNISNLDYLVLNKYSQNNDHSNNIKSSANKRPRHFFCFSCNQFKPRSTKARFKVCKHVSCYHCLRKALHVEYWAAKNDIWEKCRAECPFCHIVLDWSKMKPYIVLSLEAKQFPLMLLCDAEERQGEAFNVIHSFFPRGVPSYVIYGNGIDFSVKPKVTQILFGYYLELLNNDIETYEKFFEQDVSNINEKNSLLDNVVSSNFKTFSQCSTNSSRYCNSDKIIEEDLTEYGEVSWSGSCEIYPDLFNSWRRNILYSNINCVNSSINNASSNKLINSV